MSLSRAFWAAACLVILAPCFPGALSQAVAQAPASAKPASTPAAKPADGQPATAAATTSSKKKNATSKVYTLPDAYSGATYNETMDPGKVAWKTCIDKAVVPALPTWMKLDCSTGKFNFTGTVPVVTVEAITKYNVTVYDAGNHPYPFVFQLTLRPPAQVVPMTAEAKKAADAAAAAAAIPPAPPDYSKIQITPPPVIREGITQITSQLSNVPPGGSVHLQVWSQQDGLAGPIGPSSQVQLLSPTAPPATVPQIDFKTNPFTIMFPAPILFGQTLTLKVVTDDGKPVSSPQGSLSVDIPANIPIGTMSLTVVKPLVVGKSTISGTLDSMPNPPLPPTAASGAVPASNGNFPGIFVWWTDPISGIWSQAWPVVGATPSTFPSVTANATMTAATFSITLPSAFQAGQKVRVDVVPPPGRSFSGPDPIPAFPPPPATVPRQSLSQEITVYSDVALSQPTISSTPFNEGTTVISGTATVPTAGIPLSVAVLRLHGQSEEMPKGVDQCLTLDDLNKFQDLGVLMPLTSSANNTLLGTVDPNAGTYKVTVAEALKQGEWIQVVQVIPAVARLPELQRRNCASPPKQVQYPFDFHRTNITFVVGALLSNSSASSTTSANFSQANEFFSFNADHAWRLPGFDCVVKTKDQQAEDKQKAEDKRIAKSMLPVQGTPPAKDQNKKDADEDWGNKWGKSEYGGCGKTNWVKTSWHADAWPGINTFFEGRLTSIPVSTPSAMPTTTSTAAATGTASTLLTSEKVFRVETGLFLPWIVSHGHGEHPNGLFIAPLAKAGFDTVTGAGTQTNVVLPGGMTGTLNFQSAYKFYAYGGRIGNSSQSESHDRAPQIEHYLDVTVGRYSNLQSYICHPGPPTPSTITDPAGTSCRVDYPTVFPSNVPVIQSRKQLYRLDLEGLIKIPVPLTAIPFYIGFNANISQHTVQSDLLDHGYAPPDDIRILFGTRIDIGTLLTSLKLPTN